MILLDFRIQCDFLIDAQKPDIVVADKREKETKILDIAIPGDACRGDKELKRVEKYKLLKVKIVRMWAMRRVTVTPVVIGALRVLRTKFKKYARETGIDMRVEHAQNTALLRTARILRLVIEC
ncbi:uncharacterized protein LOC115215756 [Octopus sinensis]|uniref:Uncharacterized protein LOC115215756 n=1 Tax=Octopus sinensis TaxID=2607531 RepID=A0A6P7SRX7_9MOLL|nr:uncharacterized protein LOC115215756 [Octopus sinensis]